MILINYLLKFLEMFPLPFRYQIKVFFNVIKENNYIQQHIYINIYMYLNSRIKLT